VTFTLRIIDDLLGFSSGNIGVISPSGQQRLNSGFSPAANLISGDTLDGIYEVSLTVPQFSETGTWHVIDLPINDGLNQIEYNENDLITMGFPTELEVVSEPSLDGILVFFDEAVANGTLEGNAKKWWVADKKLDKMRKLLKTAKCRIKQDKIKAACKKLDKAYLRCDGEPGPKDYVKGEATAELADMINEVILIQCE
jgi:hypothetical protein